MIWIDSKPAFDAMIDRLAMQSVIAVDTEADSLHSYFDKVCLIQISGAGEDYIVDPLTKIDLTRFGEMLTNPSITKMLHGGDYDLRILNRDFGFTVANLIDTMICAQLLGYEAFGLAALLDRHFGLKLNKSHQRADWSMRPLPPDMLEYAATDTHHLIALAGILRQQLEGLGRWEWAMEEFSRLESVRFREADEELEAFRRLKGLGALDRRSLAVVKELHGWRDRLARTADRPPFKIIGNDAILEVAKQRPESREELAKIKSVSRYHFARYGNEIMTLVQKALALPDDALPEKGDSRPWMRDKVLEARVEKLKKVRDRIAGELKIDSSLVAPRHVLTAIATIEPVEIGQLDQIPAMREWQKRVAGEPLMAALRKQAPANRMLF